MNMIMVVIVIVRMRVRGPIMSVFMAVRCARGNRRHMGMIVVRVFVGMLVRMRNCIVGVRVRMAGHGCLLVGCGLIVPTRCAGGRPRAD
jgi:hypothetical protein